MLLDIQHLTAYHVQLVKLVYWLYDFSGSNVGKHTQWITVHPERILNLFPE